MNGKQLKNSILQWAIQGKLVPQDPNDEPASVLLDRIRQEKARLVKEKKIKKDKNESIIYRGEDNSYYEKFIATGEVKCIDEEIPFEIPQGWKWCRLRNIIKGTNAGKSPNCEKRPKNNEEWGVLTTTAIQENEFLPSENKVLPQNYKINLEHSVKYGDILITRAGPINRTGIVCMVDKEPGRMSYSVMPVRTYLCSGDLYFQITSLQRYFRVGFYTSEKHHTRTLFRHINGLPQMIFFSVG